MLSMRLWIVIALFALSACAQYQSERGVNVVWDERTLASFQTGVTTRADVMDALGPPSQLLSLGDETVLYYLNESARGSGVILVLYNRFEIDADYDRAVFIFNSQDLLADFSGWIAPSDEN